MVGVIVVDDAFEAVPALAFAALRTEFAVFALVYFTLVGRFAPSSSSLGSICLRGRDGYLFAEVK